MSLPDSGTVEEFKEAVLDTCSPDPQIGEVYRFTAVAKTSHRVNETIYIITGRDGRKIFYRYELGPLTERHIGHGECDKWQWKMWCDDYKVKFIGYDT